MDKRSKIKEAVISDDDGKITELLNSGLEPNFQGGWPIRLAARHGSYAIVKRLIQCGANPQLLGEAGASTLQLAVYSGKHWDGGQWAFLLSCCDSSQLADGAAIAIIFKNVLALKKILETGRCNANIPTTLTGKTIEQLAKGYKLHYLLNATNEITIPNNHLTTPLSSPRNLRAHRSATVTVTPQPSQSSRDLSPSVARFFEQTSRQAALTPTRSTAEASSSPSSLWINY